MEKHIPILAGAGGVGLGESRTDHSGRKAILLVREGDTSELSALAATMGIEIIEEIYQSGSPDARGFFGKGRLQDVGDDVSSIVDGHPWKGVDLVIIHSNATARQLVTIHNVIGIEIWDRVRLLLALFTSHASSVEARTQVRLAQLQADRTILREVANQQTSGERAGFGGGGQQALQGVISTVSREIAQLGKRRAKHARARTERRRQRRRGGAKTVGLAGYTNAGKSSLFRALSGKEVLVEDKLFSTLETTVGRMVASPRILLADTIGFIDELPSDLLDAFNATLDEALKCDLLLLLADSSDDEVELRRKLTTSQREIFERTGDDILEMIVVLTKTDNCGDLDTCEAIIKSLSLPDPAHVSCHTGEGMDILRDKILQSLYGEKRTIVISDGGVRERAVESLISEVYGLGIVVDKDANEMTIWCDLSELTKLISKTKGRISLK
jgi:GTP-binding protein HflX